ncbi:hypothetical protein [Streptomyces sp. NPDC017556]|uniref:hypothetical protein n=1 Tax=Streptomyces sp. NPDC017556 TaxID=3365002 RepID=UPI0037A57A07
MTAYEPHREHPVSDTIGILLVKIVQKNDVSLQMPELLDCPFSAAHEYSTLLATWRENLWKKP